MKAWRILVFIILVIGLLTALSVLVPTEELKCGGLTLKIPKPETIIGSEEEEFIDPEQIMTELELPPVDSTYASIEDTLAYYQTAMALPTKFSLPNDDYTYYDSFFASIERAYSQQRTIRILHYGDSQIELDRISNNIRDYFQSHFGGGGPGMLSLYNSVPSTTIRQSFSGNYTRYALYGGGAKNDDNDYGIMAKSFRVSGNNSFQASSPKPKRNKTERKTYNKIALFCTPRSEDFRVAFGDSKVSIDEGDETYTATPQLIRWDLDSSVADFTIKISGQADIYGVIVDNDYGVAVDNIPMRGASGTFLSQMNDTLLTSYYEMLDVGMIILQFGGNAVPSLYSEDGVNYYVKRIGSQIRYLQAVRPGVPILFIGPSDMSTRINGAMTTYPWLPFLVARLQETVLANGAAFWNLYEVMGGKNSMVAWVQKGWAGSDYIHFAPSGANQVGRVLTQSFQSMYEFYRLRKSYPDIDFDLVWQNVLKEQKTYPTYKPEHLKPTLDTNSFAVTDTIHQPSDTSYIDSTFIFGQQPSDTSMILSPLSDTNYVIDTDTIQQPCDTSYIDSTLIVGQELSDTLMTSQPLSDTNYVMDDDTLGTSKSSSSDSTLFFNQSLSDSVSINPPNF